LRSVWTATVVSNAGAIAAGSGAVMVKVGYRAGAVHARDFIAAMSDMASAMARRGHA